MQPNNGNINDFLFLIPEITYSFFISFRDFVLSSKIDFSIIELWQT